MKPKINVSLTEQEFEIIESALDFANNIFEMLGNEDFTYMNLYHLQIKLYGAYESYNRALAEEVEK